MDRRTVTSGWAHRDCRRRRHRRDSDHRGRAGCPDATTTQSKPLGAHPLGAAMEGWQGTMIEVTYPPGVVSAAHQHPGPTFGYVVRGKIRLGDQRRARQSARGRAVVFRADGVGAQHLGQRQRNRAGEDLGGDPQQAGRAVVEAGAETVEPDRYGVRGLDSDRESGVGSRESDATRTRSPFRIPDTGHDPPRHLLRSRRARRRRRQRALPEVHADKQTPLDIALGLIGPRALRDQSGP